MTNSQTPGAGGDGHRPDAEHQGSGLDRWLSGALIGTLRLYQRLVSPLVPPSCRFYPSCSCYACDALAKHGLRRGGRLALTRLLRCHPFHAGGWDPVP
jgi:hypothetical protein